MSIANANTQVKEDHRSITRENMRLLFALYFICIINIPNIQAVTDNYLSFKDKEPEFIGGNREFSSFFMKNFRYPSQATKAGVSGRLVVRFRVAKNGSVDSVRSVLDFGFGSGEEVVRVIKLTNKKWEPAKMNGRRVAKFVTLPISVDPG